MGYILNIIIIVLNSPRVLLSVSKQNCHIIIITQTPGVNTTPHHPPPPPPPPPCTEQNKKEIIIIIFTHQNYIV